MDTIFVLDVGTSSMRGVLFSLQGEILKTVQLQNPPEYLSAERVEMNPRRYADCLYRITRELVGFAQAGGFRIGAVSLTALRSCTLFCREDGEILYNAIMWHDKRAQSVCQALSPSEGEIFARTGARLSPVFSGAKYAWMRQNYPEIYEKSQRLAVVPDYLLFLLCGRWVTDTTYGSRTALMNLRTLQWDGELLRLFGVEEEKLCPLLAPGSIAGYTTEAFCRLTGLPQGTPVVSAGGDQQCGVLGAGACAPGNVHITVGSGSYVSVVTGEPIIDPLRRFVCGAAAVPGQMVLEASILSSAVLYNWFFGQFYTPQEQAMGMEATINREAAEAPAGCGDVLFLPYFQGRGSPDWNPAMPGGFLGISLGSGRGQLARAILEGIALEIAENVQLLHKAVPAARQITVGGGLTKSPLFVQILADALGEPLRLCPTGENTALGAFFSGAAALGLYEGPAQAAQALGRQGPKTEPNLTRHSLYQAALCRRQRICEALK